MPAAAPAATRILVRAGSKRNARPRKEATIAAEHRDRPLAARRPAAAERDRARRSLGKGRSDRDPSSLARDGAAYVRDVGPVVAAARPPHDHVPGDRESGGREQRAIGEDPRLGEVDRRDEVETHVGEVDQPVERDDAERARRPDRHGEGEEDRVFVEVEPVEPVGEPVPDTARAHNRALGGTASGKCGVTEGRKPGHGRSATFQKGVNVEQRDEGLTVGDLARADQLQHFGPAAGVPARRTRRPRAAPGRRRDRARRRDGSARR